VSSSFSVPSSNWLANPMITILRNYTYFRSNVRLFFKISGSPYHLGKLGVGFIPLARYDPNTGLNTSISGTTSTELSSRNHIIIDASMPGTYTMDIPFEHFVERFYVAANNQNGPDGYFRGLGTVIFLPLVALSAATGTNTTIPVTIFAQFLDSEVSMFRPLGTPSSSGMWQSGTIADMGLAVASKAFPKMSDRLGRITGIFGNRDNPIPETMNELTRRFDLFKVDGPCLAKTIGPISQLKQPTAEQMGRNPMEDFSILEILKRPVWLNSFSWTPSISSGSQLYNITVEPESLANYVTNFGATQINATPLAYFSKFYSLWRGSIDFTIDIVTTHFHRGKLMVSLIPALLSIPGDFASLSTFPHYILDVQENKTFTIKVPYDNLTPYRYIRDEANTYCFSMVITVLNTLTSNISIPSTADIVIYASAGDDFEFAAFQPKIDTFNSGYGYYTGLVTAAPSLLEEETGTMQSGVIEEGSTLTTVDETENKNVMDVFDKPVAQGMLQNKFMLISTLMKKPFLLYNVGPFVPVTSGATELIATVPVTPIPLVGNRSLSRYNFYGNVSNPCSAISSMFRFWSGSMKYRLIFNAGRTDRYICYVHWTPYALDGNSTSTGITNPWTISTPFLNYTDSNYVPVAGQFTTVAQDLMSDPIVEFTVPYMAPTSRLLTNGIPPPPASSKTAISTYDYQMYNGYLSILVQGNNTTLSDSKLTCQIWVSGGDDFELSDYMGVPVHFQCTPPFPAYSSFAFQTKQQFDAL